MSTKQTDASNAHQHDTFEFFTGLVESDFDLAEEWLLEHQEEIGAHLAVICENYLDEEKRAFEEQEVDDYQTLLHMHV